MIANDKAKSGQVQLIARRELTYADVLAAIAAASEIRPRVRSNMRSAVNRVAKLASAAGVAAPVAIEEIRSRIGKLRPAQLGFSSKGGLSAFKSNLNRALRLAGFDVMPGRSRTPISAAWAELRSKLVNPTLRIQLSRFMHYCSAQGWAPDEVDDQRFDRFVAEMRERALGSKVERVARDTRKAWERARQTMSGWPNRTIAPAPRSKRFYGLQWDRFTPEFRADVEAFVTRGANADDLFGEATGDPLRARTQMNYREAWRRMASIAVHAGVSPEDIRSLTDLANPDRAKLILTKVIERLGNRSASHAQLMAVLLLVAGRDHVKLPPDQVRQLEGFCNRTSGHRRGMADRSYRRLLQFDDARALDRVVMLPSRLMRLAETHGKIDVHSAKLARGALAIALLVDTGARSGNIVALDLKRHVIQETDALGGSCRVRIAGDEVKNREPIDATISPATHKLLRRFVDRYRPFYCDAPSDWLFPRRDGSHWSQQQAYQDIKDLAARHAGVELTPHLTRALVGKIILDERPDAYPVVQQVLGHRSIQTTMSYYAPARPAAARAAFHAMLERRRGGAPLR